MFPLDKTLQVTPLHDIETTFCVEIMLIQFCLNAAYPSSRSLPRWFFEILGFQIQRDNV